MLALLACGALLSCAPAAAVRQDGPIVARPSAAPLGDTVVAGPGGCAPPVTVPVLVDREEVRRQNAAAYPASLHGRGKWSESVLLRMRVRADGTVEPGSASVDTAAFPELGEAARTVAPGLRFRAATVDGAPVAAWVRQYLTFVDTTQAAPFGGTAQMTYSQRPALRNAAELTPETRPDAPAAAAVLRLRLSNGGEVDTSTILVQMVTDPAAEEPARDLVRRMRFSPAQVNGFVSRSAIGVVIHFGCMTPAAPQTG